MLEEDEDYQFQDPKKMPLFHKAMEIFEIVNHLADVVKDEIEKDSENYEMVLTQNAIEHMRENASLIPVKIGGAINIELYDLKMENAALIRKAAREISVNCTGLNIVSIGETDHLKMLKDEIEEFRILFAEWVKTFDPWNYIIDRWGLFNPPGVNYDDHDPDDDIPFDPNDLE